MIVLKDFCTPPLPYPVALRGIPPSSSAHVCAIGEMARSDGGVKKQKNDSVKRFLHLSPVVSRSITGVAEQYRGDTSETVVSEERG